MKQLFLLSLFVISMSASAQRINNLNHFKYVYLAPLVYENGEDDRYRIISQVKLRLEKSGLRVIRTKGPLIANPDIQNADIITCVVSHHDINNHYLFKKDTLRMEFFDCFNDKVYEAVEVTRGAEINPEKAYEKATALMLREFSSYHYSYQPQPKYEAKQLETSKALAKASFPGGLGKMDEFLSSSMIYPRGSQRLAGTVDLSFIIDPRGFVKDVQVVKGLRADIDTEARRVFLLMPRWIPGMKDGKPTESKLAYSLVVEPKGKINQERVDY
ncbi:MAG: energy transducer TonB [Spirosomataceae bacterium]